jgi:hypothetical protein
MPGEVERRLQETLITRRGPDPLAPRLPFKVQRAINREAAWGLTAAARAQAAGFAVDARIDAVVLVTERAMVAVDRLSRIEAAMAKADPVKAERYSALVDDFLTISRSEIRRLPREF